MRIDIPKGIRVVKVPGEIDCGVGGDVLGLVCRNEMLCVYGRGRGDGYRKRVAQGVAEKVDKDEGYLVFAGSFDAFLETVFARKGIAVDGPVVLLVSNGLGRVNRRQEDERVARLDRVGFCLYGIDVERLGNGCGYFNVLNGLPVEQVVVRVGTGDKRENQ